MNDIERAHTRLAHQGHRELQAPAHAPQRHRVKHHSAKPKASVGQVLLGIHIDPAWTGVIRAVAYVVLTALLDLAIIYFKAPPEGLVIYSATIVGALRALEGIADQKLKGNASAAPPVSVR